MSSAFDANYALDEKYVPHPLDGTISIDEFIVGDQAFAVQAPASFDVLLTALDDGLLVQGEVTLLVMSDCVRCLKPFETKITAAVDSMFYYETTLDDDGDPYPEVDEFGCIDLEGELIEDLIIAAPFAPIHSQDCKGICFVCGADRNVDPCRCAEDAVDETHPFACLDMLLDKGDE